MVPRDRAFNTLLTSTLEAGDHELGTSVEAFRFQDALYKIQVSEQGERPNLPELDIIQPPRPPAPPRLGE